MILKLWLSYNHVVHTYFALIFAYGIAYTNFSVIMLISQHMLCDLKMLTPSQ